MRSRIRRGAIAGFVAAVPMGIAMHLLEVATPFGERMPMALMIARFLGFPIVVVWIGNFVISAAIGACFGWWFGSRARDAGGGIGWGIVHGVIWWVVRVIVLLPLVMGLPTFATLTHPSWRPIAVSGLVAHLLYGVVLGLVYVWLLRVRPAPAESRS